MEEAMDPVTPFQPRNVLFIGNSHTQNNQGIDFHVRGFLQNTDLEYTAHVEKMALGGYTLEDHLNDENTNNKISELEWDIIVLQENTFVVVNDNFKAKVNIENFKYRINNEATQLYLFMTWAYEDDPGSYQLIKNVYEEVAPLVDGTIVAVGTAFRAITVESSIALDL
jgi:hypothetical protein